jgi:hypothetical protein
MAKESIQNSLPRTDQTAAVGFRKRAEPAVQQDEYFARTVTTTKRWPERSAPMGSIRTCRDDVQASTNYVSTSVCAEPCTHRRAPNQPRQDRTMCLKKGVK